jgi:hypothetical protein
MMTPDLPTPERTEDSPAPGAVARILDLLAQRVGVERMDRLWIFPPLVRGRKEWGLVAVSCQTEEADIRELITGSYMAELTGQGVTFQPELASEGRAPSDRLPRIMDGVVRRSDLQLEVPREVDLGADPERLRALLEEYRIDEVLDEG